MDVTTQQRLLYAIACVGLLGTAGAVHWATSSLQTENAEFRPTVSGNSGVAEPPADAASDPPSEKLTMSLRGPLYDPPPPPPKPRVVQRPPSPAPTPKPKLNFVLVGTIIDADQRLAIVADDSGDFDVKGIGDALELTPQGARIEQIESEQITLQHAGNESTLRLLKQKQASGAGNRRNKNRGRIP